MKSEIVKYAETLEGQVQAGEVNALEAFVFLKKVEKASDAAKKRIQEMAIEELEKHGIEAKSLKMYGATISLKNGPSRYDFKHITEIQLLKEKVKALEALHKQAAQTEAVLVNEETGHIIEPATKTPGKQIINIKFDK